MTKETTKQTTTGNRYKVLIDDNFHFMDKEHRYEHGVFGTADEAVAACKRIVDNELTYMLKPGMTADALYDQWVMFGEDPFVMPVDRTDARVGFAACEYAKERCKVLTQPAANFEHAANLAYQIATAPLRLLPEIDAPPIAP
jgi:hypothetical protein